MLELRKTLCTFCGVGDQVSVNSEGDVFGTGSLGVCTKGSSYFRDRMRGHEDAERFTSPMMRTVYGWERVSWEYAIDMTADTILADRAEYGRDSIAFYGVGQMTMESMWVAKKFFQGHLGTNNVCSNAEQCLANNAGGHELVFGNEGPFSCYEDYLHAGAIMIYGHNPAANHPTVFQRYMRRNRDAVKVIVDPRVTNTVQTLLEDDPANIHIQINSGSDVLLNLAIARQLLDSGRVNSDYVAAHVDPGAHRTFLDLVLSDRCSMDTVIPLITPPHISHAEMKSRLMRVVDLWATRKVVSTSSVGINQTTGSSGVATILNLHLLTGNIGMPGRGHVRLAGQSNAAAELALGYSARLLPFRKRIGEAAHRAQMADVWGLPEWKISDKPGLPVANFATSDRLRTLLIFGTNPARNFPNLNEWRRRLQDLFIIYVDSYHNPEILEFADMILPCRTKHEINGIYLNGERRLQYLAKVAEPPVEAWSDVRIVCEIAKSMADRMPPVVHSGPRTQAEVDDMVAQGNLDLDRDAMTKSFSYQGDEKGEPCSVAIWNEIQCASRGHYNEFIKADGKPIEFENITAEEGVQWAGVRRYTPDTPGESGAIFPGVFRKDLHLATLHVPASERLTPFVARNPHDFILITGRGSLGRGTGTLNVSLFNSATATGRKYWPDENLVYICPADARRVGFARGDLIEMFNAQGVISAHVEISDDVPARHLYMSFHPDKKGSMPNLLTRSDNNDPHTWQPLLKDTQVGVRKAPPS
jgi:anaerobic selenocysteine-containing dehydrogenase